MVQKNSEIMVCEEEVCNKCNVKKPQKEFSYQTLDDEDFKKCWALNNLRLLCALKNIKRNYE